MLLDISKSMRFTSRGISKLEYGCFVGACLAYLAQRQRDRVGLITFDNDIVDRTCRRRPSTSTSCCTRWTGRRRSGPGNLAIPLNKMAEHFTRRGILVLISDFYEEPDTILEAIKPLKFLGNDLIVFHVLDPAELDFGYEDASSFEDLETGEQIPVVPESLREGISRDDPGAHRRADDQVLRAPDRLHRAEHGRTARPRAVQLSVEPRAADASTMTRMSQALAVMQRLCLHVMAFLTPFFLLGLAAIAIPVLIHLIQRERKRVIEFPSLMFVRRIPYQSVRRRRIRHWALLLLRAAAIALIVAAFARPFFQQGAVAAAVGGGAREVVILLDQSASMGYGDHWARAQEAARTVVRGLGPDDNATLVLFAQERRGEHARDRPTGRASKRRSTRPRSGRARPATVRRSSSRESILSRSPIKRREAVLISDFQRSGWSGSEEVRFPEGMTRQHGLGRVAEYRRTSSVPSVTFARASFSGQERITVTAGLSNKGDAPVKDVPVTLDHRRPRDRDRARHGRAARVGLGLLRAVHADRRRTCAASSRPEPTRCRPTTRSISCSRRASRSRWSSSTAAIARDGSLFLSKALSIGTTPAFQVDVTTAVAR